MSAGAGLIETAFAPNQILKKQVFQAISETPKHQTLFEDIASYTLSLQSSSTDLPPAKKRKVEQNGAFADAAANTLQHPGGFPKGTVEGNGALEFEMPDLSFSIPVRKKLKFQMWGNGFSAIDQKTGEGEWYMNGKHFQHAFRLPVPEKAQKQSMFILLPDGGNGTGQPPLMPDSWRPEPAVFAVADNQKAQVAARILDETLMSDSKLKDDIANGRPLEAMLKRWIGANSLENECLIEPNEKEFASAIPEAHRKSEKAFHVRAFRGTKDGFLFLLSTGLIFTPKKPILFFPFSSIKSISYSSVVQRTFSLNVTTRTLKDNPNRESIEEDDEANWETNDFEFSHIDQKDFAGIDAWVKKHGLDDESLASGRRAKVVTVNKKKKNEDRNGDGEGESELRKAEREIEEAGEGAEGEDDEERDSEDEREEDYDPGSEGESEGSGTSDESDDDDEQDKGERRSRGGRNRDGAAGKDLVQEDLGSEAEDVELEEDEDDDEGGEGDGEEEEEDEEDEGEGDVQETEQRGGDVQGALPNTDHNSGFNGPALDDDDQL
ncbi:MAG: hypothetical protein Q9160_009003 [Pyrenula sp. 1 TL-2023]